MSLPDTRNTNYAPLTQVASADLNDVQDSIARRSHGNVKVLIPPSAMEHTNDGGGAIPDLIWIPDEHWAISSGTFQRVVCPLVLPMLVGAEMTEIVAHVRVAAASGATVGMAVRLAAASFTGPTNIGTQIEKFSPAAGPADYTVVFDTSDALLPFTIGPGTEYPFLEFESGDGGGNIWDVRGVEVTFRQPIVPAPA